MESAADEPLVRLYQLFPNAPAPVRAERSLFGTIPLRAHAYCEPFTAASAFGWWSFPPVDFALMWEGGSTVLWKLLDSESWDLLDTAVVPGLAEQYARLAPKDAPAHPPAFLSAQREGGKPAEPGLIQIWTGLIAKTRRDWALLIRPPANLPRDSSFEVFEGVIETDWWFGPLWSNIRFCRTKYPIVFRTGTPLLQIQPIPKCAYSDRNLDSMVLTKGIQDLSQEDWKDYSDAFDMRLGGYKTGVYRRRQGTESSR